MHQPDLSQYTHHYTGSHPHRYIAYDLSLPENQSLKSILVSHGFHLLHSTNNLHIVYKHQIIAFYNCGGIHAAKRGFSAPKGLISIHHINGNTFDNRPQNLVYLQDDLHNQITQSQRHVFKGLQVWKKSSSRKVSQLPPIWNKQGRLVKDVLNFILKYLTLTLVKTSQSFNLSISFKSIKSWLHKLKKQLLSSFSLPSLLPIWIGDKLPPSYLNSLLSLT